MTTTSQATFKINDKEYNLADLSDEAKAQLDSLRFTDAEIARLNAQLAIAQTARNSYLRVLVEKLPTPIAKAALN